MAKSLYIGVSGKCRKATKAYIGVNGVARKIKKMYIGVNGVARLFYSGAKQISVLSNTTVENVNPNRSYLASASSGSHAIFAGGAATNNVLKNTVDAYDTLLTRTQPSSQLTSARSHNAGVSFNSNAIFAGGKTAYNTNNCTNEVCYYNNSLTRTGLTGLDAGQHSLTGAATSTHAMFGGGNTSTYGNSDARIAVYDKSLTKSTLNFTHTDYYNYGKTACANKDIILFVGSGTVANRKSVDGFNTSLTKLTVPDLSADRDGYLCVNAVTVNEYIIFASAYTTPTNVVDVYNTSLTHTTMTIPYVHFASSISLAEHGLIIGGYNVSDSTVGYRKKADVIDMSLTVSSFNITEPRYMGAAAMIGNKVINAGGMNDGNYTACTTADVIMED